MTLASNSNQLATTLVEFQEIIGNIDLLGVIVEHLPIASCPVLLCVHRACAHKDVGLIELLGDRLHISFEDDEFIAKKTGIASFMYYKLCQQCV